MRQIPLSFWADSASNINRQMAWWKEENISDTSLHAHVYTSEYNISVYVYVNEKYIILIY